ncbi:MAG: cation transporter [Campylobacteraceae bacterium]|nr:cation transporter [Campylobacteraceae bacterium]
MNLKTKAPLVAGVSAFILANVKLLVGVLSGSMAVISSAMDSIMDSLISAANYIAADKADKAPDTQFNYGYAKLEALMGFVEGFFITGIGLFLIYASGVKFFSEPEVIKTDIALYVMIFSTIVTFLLILFLQSSFKQTGSLIIKADILHYKTDLFTNIGIIVALVIVKLTGYILIDAIIGVFIGIFIVYSAISLIKESGRVLIDEAVPEAVLKDIEKFIDSHSGVTSHHDLKTRKSVDKCYLSAHIVFDTKISLLKAHTIGDEIEDYIRDTYSEYSWDINLHFDPSDDSE